MAAPGRRRADVLLVERGFFESRARARAAIEAGLVRAGDAAVGKPSDLIAPDAAIVAAEAHPWVSRGGVKLASALDAFGWSAAGLACLDVGASTGGFSDVLLAHGAASVVAVDIGCGQLHARIAGNPRVTSLESTDARRLVGVVPDASIDLAVIDVSFISLALVLPGLMPHLRPQARVIALVKPQFEVGREGVGRGGLVRDDALRQRSVDRIVTLLRDLGLSTLAPITSPIAGGDGNVEFLIGAHRG